jgi:hypothetical protein
MICPKCGAEMNHHADKIDYASEDESVNSNDWRDVSDTIK